jgi:hypothetical protein
METIKEDLFKKQIDLPIQSFQAKEQQDLSQRSIEMH